MSQEEQAKNDNAGAAEASAANAADAKREISTIQFPYGDLDDAVAFAKAIREVGGQSCLVEQLAGFLKVAPTGGAFRARMSHPRIFGLVDHDKGAVSLSPLGMKIVDPTQEPAARVDAFLSVPLYRAVYEKYKGYTLPPPAALEREMAGLGVSSKQTDKARQVFDRSARQAGFFWAGNERLTLPVTKGKQPESRPLDESPPPGARPPGGGGASGFTSGGGGGGGNDSSYHPFIEGLLKTLPQTGTPWPVKDRAKWLKLAANAFDLIYEGAGEEEIEISATAPK